MARANRAERRRLAVAAHRRLVAKDAPAPAARPVILAGLPGGEPYVPERAVEAEAMAVFEALAMMHPGMEQRAIMARRLGLPGTAPRARAEEGLIEVHGDVSLARLREFGIHGV